MLVPEECAEFDADVVTELLTDVLCVEDADEVPEEKAVVLPELVAVDDTVAESDDVCV